MEPKMEMISISAQLETDIQNASSVLVESFRNMKKELDYSIDSLKLVDEYLGRYIIEGEPVGLLKIKTEQQLFSIAAYLGEVILKNNKESKWVIDKNNSDSEASLAVQLQDGILMWPSQRVLARVKLGSTEGLWFYAKHVSFIQGSTTDAKGEHNIANKHWWKFW